ncbi:MAG: PqqD family protein [Bacteroidales bacterium]|nr:PqqD family protein [Bacteroidales bacterium]
MRINKQYKVRAVAGENIILIPGNKTGDMTKVAALNDTSLFLWNKLNDRDFTIQDAANALTEAYDTDDATARHDAEAWINQLKDLGIIE